jgi:cell division septation protein DedD
MSDEGFQEIHLGNKQLVFLAMTGVVVLVVAFLFGVLVGRGVGSQEPAPLVADAGTVVDTAAAGAAAEPAPVAAPPSAAPLSAPEPIADELSYPQRLEAATPANDSLAAAARTPPAAKPPAVTPPAAKASVPDPVAAAPASGLVAEPAGPGFAVQVVALRDRAKAEGVARRLASKGHRAYVVAPGGRGGAMYRVVVGKFKSRQEADQVKRRIEKEEQFKPWIIR